MPYEVANVLARLRFDGALEIAEVNDIGADLVAALGLVLHPFDAIRDGREVAAISARLHGRHATDSTYVWLAQRLGTAGVDPGRVIGPQSADLGLPVQFVS